MTQEKEPVYVNCRDCHHEWVAFYTPLTLDTDGMALLDSVSKSRCPMCSSKNVVVGKSKEVAA